MCQVQQSRMVVLLENTICLHVLVKTSQRKELRLNLEAQVRVPGRDERKDILSHRNSMRQSAAPGKGARPIGNNEE